MADKIYKESDDFRDTSTESSDGIIQNYPIKEWEVNFNQYTYDKLPKNMYSKSLKPFAMALIASRNSGKTAMFRYLFKNYLKGHFEIIIIFSNTIDSGQYDFLDTDLKYHSYDPEVLRELAETQREYKQKHGKYFNTLIIFDDCIHGVKEEPEIENVFLMGRHSATSICFISQSPTLLKTTWRQNITLLMVLRIKGLGKEYIINNFLLDLIDDDEYKNESPKKYLSKLIKSVTDIPYTALVIDYELLNREFFDCVKYFKAPL